jgi:hypothetical protein
MTEENKSPNKPEHLGTAFGVLATLLAPFAALAHMATMANVEAKLRHNDNDKR